VNRRLRILGSFTLIGVFLSLSVAWTCALWSPMRGSRALTYLEADAVLRKLTGGFENSSAPQGVRNWGFGWAFVFAVDATIPVPDVATASSRRSRGRQTTALVQLPSSPDDRLVHIVTAGWPLTCLTGERHTVGVSTRRHSLAEPPSAVRDLNVLPRRVLPLRPLWFGLTANTALYAAAVWLAVPGPILLRRTLRRRRGRCPACGYILRHVEHHACPECGAAA
jgi:hypothetical protein